MAPTGHDFVFSANKALVWRRYAWWAIAMGPLLPAASVGTQQSGRILVSCSIGVDRNRFRLFDRIRPRVTPMGLDKSSDTSGYIQHGHAKPAKRRQSGGSLHWRRPDTILCFRRIRPWCGGAVHGGRLRRVRFHLMHVWRISKADGCGCLAPSGSTGLDFVFLANEAACGGGGA